MPPSNIPKHNRKKKKGHAPTHQNSFAWAHNPKSKKTLKILELPNSHLCRRCHDKIEWRKKYRKYKPRTQPGKCNLCQQRRVMAAYHTICEQCTQSNKAKKAVRDHLDEEQQQQSSPVESGLEKCSLEANPATAPPCNSTNRACAMCVKDFDLAHPDNDGEDEQSVLLRERMPLRQRKTLERQMLKSGSTSLKEDVVEDPIEEEGSENGGENTDASNELGTEKTEEDSDPFLKAVGGADKLVTGEAYQQALLQKEMP